MRSWPLATQIGALMPRSYCSATAKWVGLVITTVALGTAAIMRLRMRETRSWRILALIFGSPSCSLNSSLHLAQRHLLPLEPLAVLEQVVGRRDQGEDRHHRAEQLQRQRAGERRDRGRIGRDQAFEPLARRPHQQGQDRADHRELDEALDEIGQRLLGEQPLGAGERRDLRQLRRRAPRPTTPGGAGSRCRRSRRAPAAGTGSRSPRASRG